MRTAPSCAGVAVRKILLYCSDILMTACRHRLMQGKVHHFNLFTRVCRHVNIRRNIGVILRFHTAYSESSPRNILQFTTVRECHGDGFVCRIERHIGFLSTSYIYARGRNACVDGPVDVAVCKVRVCNEV